MNQEDAFAEEAQEQTLLRNRSSASDEDLKPQIHSSTSEEHDYNDESSPLIADRPQRPERQGVTRAGDRYQRALNEPWKGAHGSGPLPWWKRPSVRLNTKDRATTS